MTKDFKELLSLIKDDNIKNTIHNLYMQLFNSILYKGEEIQFLKKEISLLKNEIRLLKQKIK